MDILFMFFFVTLNFLEFNLIYMVHLHMINWIFIFKCNSPSIILHSYLSKFEVTFNHDIPGIQRIYLA